MRGLSRVAQQLVMRLALPLALALAGGAAHAGLFDDEEARKAILELRQRQTTSDEATRLRLAELGQANKQLIEQQSQLLEQLAGVRRSLLELNNQLDALRSEQASLRGNNEQLAREVAELQRRQRDAVQAMDDRLRKVEPVKVSVDGAEFLADPDEKRLFDDALAQLRGGDFERASAALSAFLRRYPASGYAPSARYWLGNAQYGRRDHKEAIANFRALVAAEPGHARAPEALLGLANSQAEMRDVAGARKTLNELIKSYPKSEAAAAGKERLATLK